MSSPSLLERVRAHFPTAAPISEHPNYGVYEVLNDTGDREYLKVFASPRFPSFMKESDIYSKLAGSVFIPARKELVPFDGGDLKGLLLSDAGLSLEKLPALTWSRRDFLKFFRALLSALKALHEEGWMHGDVHPGNVCLSSIGIAKPELGEVKVIDFGLLDLHGNEAIRSRMGREGFLAPELRSKGSKASVLADSYSAGKIAEWILSNPARFNVHLDDGTSQIEKLNESLLPIYGKMLEEDPNYRDDIATVLAIIDAELSQTEKKGDLEKSSLLLRSLQEMRKDILENRENSKYLDVWDNPRTAMLFPQIGFVAADIVQRYGQPPEGFEMFTTFDESINSKEREYRELFVSDRTNPALSDPYLLLEDLFEISPTPYTKIPLSADEENYYFVFKDALEDSPESVIAPTYADFIRNWRKLTHGMFDHVNFDNVFVAGGAVLAALQPDLQGLEEGPYFNTDIDVFLYGLPLEKVKAKIAEVFEAIQRAAVGKGTPPVAHDGEPMAFNNYTDKDIIVIRNLRSLTLIPQYPRRQIQIIFRLFKSPAEVLMGFDIDSCCFGFDGRRVYGLPRAVRALTKRYNLVDITRRSASYEYRLFKYAKRGFAVACPHVDSTQIKVRGIRYGEGLARLLSLQFNMLLPDYYIEEFGDDPAKMDQGAIIQADRRIEKLQNTALADRDLSNYQSIKIPYGEKWKLERIVKYIQGFWNAIYGATWYGPLQDLQAQNDEGREDMDRIQPIVSSVNCLACLEKEVARIQYSGITFHSFGDSWMVENPGKQLLTGSFEPIISTWEEWVKDAYQE
ncbi:Protein mono-ADP-ribosyltransferase parp4 [Phlyctochytrium bullatum]|nr:Protein mono-ADP-ribosyltransferase parp4 [Phlyctochytrium bullatum]